ncbi:hypothetical protein BH10BAC3_BH10BAC3_37990 [soil metagenome]
MEDIAKILSEKIEKSQAILANWRDPQNRLSDKEALQQLNNILDISVLTALKELDEVRKLLAARAKV